VNTSIELVMPAEETGEMVSFMHSPSNTVKIMCSIFPERQVFSNWHFLVFYQAPQFDFSVGDGLLLYTETRSKYEFSLCDGFLT